MDFVRVSIVCLLLKTFEMDFLYDDMERYDSEIWKFSDDITFKLLLDYLLGSDLSDIVYGKVGEIFGDDDEDDEDIDSEDTEDQQSSEKP